MAKRGRKFSGSALGLEEGSRSRRRPPSTKHDSTTGGCYHAVHGDFPDLHRPLRTTTPRLNDILCHREQRYVGAQLTFHYDRKQIILEQLQPAKGRVERANRTLQDRLVKELRLAGVSGMDAGNAFLPGFVMRYNERFAVRAASSTNMHRPCF